MPLTPGTRFGPYEVVAALGSGGMGEVYRARDTRLGRDVALKLLPESLGADPQRVARFQREAQVLASLNHPHIAQIYGVEEANGTPALAIELVEGVSLAERIDMQALGSGLSALGQGAGGAPSERSGQGPQPRAQSRERARGLPLDAALAIARQIVDALETAHDKGIVHRDLKPANVMLTRDGNVKVLDFGLAAVVQDASQPNIDGTHSPTLTVAATRAGVILGTAAYTSPEQAAGTPVDKRADIWSFGVVLWELLTGTRLFDGETVSHTLADVLRAPIDFDKLPSATPHGIRELLRRCLERDAKKRLRDIGEARIAIDATLSGSSAIPVPANSSSRGASARLAMVGTVAVVASMCAAALAYVHFSEAPAAVTPVRFQIPPPEGTAYGANVVLSPDGRHLAFVARGGNGFGGGQIFRGRTVLWIRSLDSLEVRALAGTEGAAPGALPFWSPDSRFIGFVDGERVIKTIGVSGGPAQKVAECPGFAPFRGGAWSAHGFIVYACINSGLMRVPESGGNAVAATTIDGTRREQHSGPWFLPDGRRFLYLRTSAIADENGVYLGSVDRAPDAQDRTRFILTDSNPAYVQVQGGGQGGYVLFLRESTLLAQPFDPTAGRPTGDAVPVAEDVASTAPGFDGRYGWFSASRSGSLTYRAGAALTLRTELSWVGRKGEPLGSVGPPGNFNHFNIAPDGSRVVASQASRAWIAEVRRGVFSRLVTADSTAPVISGDGRVAFSSTLDGGVGDLYVMPVTGIGAPEPLLAKSPTVKHPNHFSPDGRFLLFDDHSATQRQDLWVLPLRPNGSDPTAGRKPIPFLVTPADETFGQFSPDGRWVAYSSDESGRWEVYVQGFTPDRVPAAGIGKWQISTAGGDKPRWSPDGKEIYYIAPDQRLMAVPVRTGATFEPGVASALLETNVVGFWPYSVAPDGRFLMLTPTGDDAAASPPVTVILNWQAAIAGR